MDHQSDPAVFLFGITSGQSKGFCNSVASIARYWSILGEVWRWRRKNGNQQSRQICPRNLKECVPQWLNKKPFHTLHKVGMSLTPRPSTHVHKSQATECWRRRTGCIPMARGIAVLNISSHVKVYAKKKLAQQGERFYCLLCWLCCFSVLLSFFGGGDAKIFHDSSPAVCSAIL